MFESGSPVYGRVARCGVLAGAAVIYRLLSTLASQSYRNKGRLGADMFRSASYSHLAPVNTACKYDDTAFGTWLRSPSVRLYPSSTTSRASWHSRSARLSSSRTGQCCQCSVQFRRDCASICCWRALSLVAGRRISRSSSRHPPHPYPLPSSSPSYEFHERSLQEPRRFEEKELRRQLVTARQHHPHRLAAPDQPQPAGLEFEQLLAPHESPEPAGPPALVHLCPAGIARRPEPATPRRTASLAAAPNQHGCISSPATPRLSPPGRASRAARLSSPASTRTVRRPRGRPLWCTAAKPWTACTAAVQAAGHGSVRGGRRGPEQGAAHCRNRLWHHLLRRRICLCYQHRSKGRHHHRVAGRWQSDKAKGTPIPVMLQRTPPNDA